LTAKKGARKGMNYQIGGHENGVVNRIFREAPSFTKSKRDEGGGESSKILKQGPHEKGVGNVEQV